MLDAQDVSELVLGQLMKRMEDMFHPSLYEQVMHDVGNNIGKELAVRRPKPPRPTQPSKPEDYLSYLECVRSSFGWVRDVSMNESASTVDVCIGRCPFGNLPANNPHLCLIEAGMIGGIAGEHFGYAKISIAHGPGDPRINCRLTAHVGRTPEALLVEGPHFPLERDTQAGGADREAAKRTLAQLSLRERQIIKLVGEGLSDKEIAGLLHLSVRTVEGHLARIRGKTGMSTRSSLIRFALKVLAH
jgi:DNA-binding CsgD family transcriptional regulator